MIFLSKCKPNLAIYCLHIYIYVRLKISVLRTKYINSLQLVYILLCESTVQIPIYEHVPREF